MSSARINIDAIPKLSHDPSSYAPWRAAVEIALQLADCWNAALGLDLEPRRIGWASPVAGGGAAVIGRDRRRRAGSAMPTESEAGGVMTAEDKKDWERWQARESRAQAILKGTASEAVRLDIEDLLAAVDMWRYCDRMHEADLLENQRIVQARLWTLDLKGDASADDMSAHVETFSKAIADGKRVGIVLSDCERAQRFLSTILDPAFNIVRAELAPIAKDKQTWSVVLSKYTAEIARRRARPPHGGSLSRDRFDQYGLTERNHGDVMVAERRRVKARKDDECWRCGEMGHWERDCKAARQRKTHGDRRDRQRRHRDQQSDTDDDEDSDESSDDERSVADKDKDKRPTKEKRITIPVKASTGLLAAGMEWIGLTVAANEWADLLGNPWAESKAVVTAAERIVEVAEIVEIAEAGETACDAVVETIKTAEGIENTAKTVVETVEIVETGWVIDSGATHHLTPHRSILKSVRALETPVAFGLASGGTVEAVEAGEVEVKLSGRRLTLQDVYLVPTARVSVCSLSRLLARGWQAEIKDDGGTLQREDETLTLSKRGSLWTVALKTASHALGYTAAARDVEAETAVRESQGDVEGKTASFGDQKGAGGACDEKEAADTGQRSVDTVDTGKAELGISPAYQSEVPLTKSPATVIAANHLKALGQEDQYAAQEHGYMRVSAVNDDGETSDDTETMSSRRPADDRDEVMPRHVSESKRRNADRQLAHHQQGFAACARGVRDCMHAGGAGGHQGEAGLPGDTKITEIDEEMTENGRIASEQPGGGRSLDRAPSASVVPGLYCHKAKIDRLQATSEVLDTAAETLVDELQPADFEGEC